MERLLVLLFEQKNKNTFIDFTGLLLIPNLDTIFDHELITFDTKGKIIISSQLGETAIELLGIRKGMNIKVNENHLKYLKFHNEVALKGKDS